MSTPVAPGSILCGVDFSDRSDDVIREGVRFARDLGADLVVATAVDPLIAHAAASRYGPDRFIEETQRELDALVSATIPVGHGTLAWTTRVAIGAPVDVLCEIGREHDARAIVVGTRGHGAAQRLWFGSTTARLLARADRPVLAVPHQTPERVAQSRTCESVVCGIDFQSASIAAAREATAIGARLAVPVTLLHVAGGPVVRAAMQDAVHDVIRAQAELARKELADLAATLPGPPATEVLVGRADVVLLSKTSAATNTLLVVGLGGGLTRRPGTTAMAILASAVTPVLCVPD